MLSRTSSRVSSPVALVGALQSGDHRRGRLGVSVVVVDQPRRQADGRIRDAVQRLRARRHHEGVLDLRRKFDQLLVRAPFLG